MSRRIKLPAGLTVPTGRRRKGSTPEGQVLKSFLQLLWARRCWCWRNNSGQVTTADGRPVRFGLVGSADIIGCLASGRFLAVEVKAAGNKPTKAQMCFLERVRDCGGVGFWADDIRTLIAVLDRLDRDPHARFTIDGAYEP